jgi:hypothetical protein
MPRKLTLVSLFLILGSFLCGSSMLFVGIKEVAGQYGQPDFKAQAKAKIDEALAAKNAMVPSFDEATKTETKFRNGFNNIDCEDPKGLQQQVVDWCFENDHSYPSQAVWDAYNGQKLQAIGEGQGAYGYYNAGVANANQGFIDLGAAQTKYNQGNYYTALQDAADAKAEFTAAKGQFESSLAPFDTGISYTNAARTILANWWYEASGIVWTY